MRTRRQRASILDGLAQLIDQSLLSAGAGWGGDAEPRYGMLLTLREDGLELLAANGETEAVRRRHALHYLALVEAALPWLTGPQQAGWLARLEREHDNVRAALQWRCERAQVELGLRFATGLCRHALGDDAFTTAWATGQVLPIEEAVAEAMGGV